ncbi:glycoside hydrolase family 66 protein [Arenibacter sp. F26102]|uniref:glycoside hydrolase family 66 protein n=1 Tax=Arenibacter sp. F26102 TaxID=2926416 RepID=UPI001FF1044E|nr:glycoside hydrolase family 66 protein [Arenibacter sp. F26102]MCK0145327.1 glycoside hydrolase family 66 protein [Arenibacter sp. F26102]
MAITKIALSIRGAFFLLLLLVFSCSKDNDAPNEAGQIPGPPFVYNEVLNLVKDKSKYAPGEKVLFTVNTIRPNTRIIYKYLGQIVHEEPLISNQWEWTPPADDFKGYMVELIEEINGKEIVLGTTAIDVSSDWTKFPRYGFLSYFGDLTDSKMSSILLNLKDFHINGLQFYDWHAKHHIPLPLDDFGRPNNSWVDLFNREIQLATVEGYIDLGHELNISSMFYNLLFGVWKPEVGDGFLEEWLIFNDQFHNNINAHDLESFGKILVANPKNLDWQQYIFNKTNQVYTNLDFDGWHLDQLGDRGIVYDYNGYQVNLKNGFNEFLYNLTDRFPDKIHVLNAVDQYGQKEILSTPINFAYSEVWSRTQYADLIQVIIENNLASNHKVNTVLAAYLNYEATEGSFNTPAVLMADAVIFAFGGAHLELGEHMLYREYFPSNNLVLPDELKNSLKEYYDFMTAYENLLRDGGDFNMPNVTSNDLSVNNWPPITGNVAVVGKNVHNKQILHLLNFNGVSTLNWRDNQRAQTNPDPFYNINVMVHVNMPVSKVWVASPDYMGGASQELDFQSDEGQITISLPYLEYWSMIVIEY